MSGSVSGSSQQVHSVMSSTPSNFTENLSQTSRYKETCRFFLSSSGCYKGSSCSYVHQTNQDEAVSSYESNPAVESEAPPSKPQNLCTSFVKYGNCRFGYRCKFLHARPNDQLPPRFQRQRDAKNGKSDPKPCSLFEQSGTCRYGDKCKFSHQVEDEANGSAEKKSTEVEKPPKVEEPPKKKPPKKSSSVKPERKRLCRYFKAGECIHGSKCKFWHPGDLPDIDDNGSSPAEKPEIRVKPAKFSQAKQSNRVFNRSEDYDAVALTQEAADILRKKEVTLLQKRYPKAVTKDDGSFGIVFTPTDPDWPYDVKELKLNVNFPPGYPKEVMKITLADNNERIPDTVGSYLEEAINSWVNEKHSKLMEKGRVELVFRPFFKWLDKNLEELFTEGLKIYQRELMAAQAGLEFFPVEKLQKDLASRATLESPQSSEESDEATPNSDPEQAESPEETPEDTPEEVTKTVNLDPAKRGTELKLTNAQLKEATASLLATKISLVVQCSRCKNKTDLSTPADQVNSVACVRCNNVQLVTFRASLVHQISSILGYLDLVDCSAHDVQLSQSSFMIGCLACNKQMTMQGLPPGQPKDTWCHHCHEKMRVAVESVRFLNLQPVTHIDASKAVKVEVKAQRKVIKDPAIKLGQPLPDDGTCKHYKKSFRWLRFPCCGKAYPCDICHDENETDHDMKYANRMICGFCCKEQMYAVDKPCSGCSNFMTKNRTSHWEGGKGCRDKTVMSKGDDKKYKNLQKTVSRAAQAKKEPQKANKKSE